MSFLKGLFNKKEKKELEEEKKDVKKSNISKQLFNEPTKTLTVRTSDTDLKDQEKQKNRHSLVIGKDFKQDLEQLVALEEVNFGKINKATDEVFGKLPTSFTGKEAQHFRTSVPKYKPKEIPQDKVRLNVFIVEPKKPKKPDQIIKAYFFVLNDKWTKQFKWKVDSPYLELRKKILQFIKNHKSDEKLTVDDIIIKSRGKNEFFIGDEVQLYDFEYFRAAIEDEDPIEVNVFQIEKFAKNISTLYPDDGSNVISYDYEKPSYSHEEISVKSQNTEEKKVMSSWDMYKKPFKIVIKRLLINEYIGDEKDMILAHSSAQILNGNQPFSDPFITGPTGLTKETFWNYTITFPEITISDLFCDSHLVVTIYGNKMSELQSQFTENNPVIPEQLGWVRIPLFDHMNALQTGILSTKIWPGAPDGIPTTTQNPNEHAPILEIEFEKFVAPVVYPKGLKKDVTSRIPTNAINHIINEFYLHEMPEKDKLLIWNYRNEVKKHAKALPKLLQSCDWNDYSKRYEMYKLLQEWKKFSNPFSALELLDPNFQDPIVRKHAISYFETFTDHELSNIMLQLVEIIKFETEHFSPLVKYLLMRSVKNPHVVGHRLFWSLRSQLENDRVRERFSLIIEEYLRVVDPNHKLILENQILVVCELLKVANYIISQPKSVKNEDLTQLLRKKLKEMILPKTFTTPLDIKMELNGLVIDECKVMSSKKRPLKLTFSNADELGDPFIIFFKAGDDLRQDELTLQMLRVMDDLWKKEGLDLHINAYGCISTSDNVGMIQCVLNSTTIAKITSGSVGQVTAKDPILNWIKDQCKTDELIATGVDNFKFSCAGYLVATHVLGIGDRHSDNIMITNRGDLFHIDFGHFLGNYKKYMGVKKETAPFVFTAAYAHVLGGTESEKYKELQEITGKAFNILRKNYYYLMSLFKLMVHAGLPELKEPKDISWIREKLVLHATEKQACDHFNSLFLESLQNKMQYVSDIAHYWKHYH